MGHVRLGKLPNTRPWTQVVATIAEGADVAAVAAATTAAARGLKLARGDDALCETVFLLVRLGGCAASDDFRAALRDAGLEVGEEVSVLGIAVGLGRAVEVAIRRSDRPGDIGELARLAAVESVTSVLAQRSAGLFGTTAAEVRRGAAELATPRGFALLAHDFFSRFLRRFLGYHLGRELACHVGGNGRFTSTTAHTTFNDELDIHCREAAGIMRTYAEGWYAKALRANEFSRERTRQFVNYSLTKLKSELAVRGRRHGQ